MNEHWDFCTHAIEDVAGWIRHMDTKVSIILGASGAILAGMLSLSIEGADLPWLRVVWMILQCGWLMALLVTLYFGVQTIAVRGPKPGMRPTYWFFDPAEYGNETLYEQQIMRASKMDLLADVSAELYRLNAIYRTKAWWARRTINAFTVFVFLCVGQMITLL